MCEVDILLILKQHARKQPQNTFFNLLRYICYVFNLHLIQTNFKSNFYYYITFHVSLILIAITKQNKTYVTLIVCMTFLHIWAL